MEHAEGLSAVATYILRRMVSAIAIMAMVGIFVFLLLRQAPGDPATIITGNKGTPQIIADIHEQLRLNEPRPVQFVNWAVSILSGDVGTSISAGRPVLELISQRLEPTISLSILTMIVSMTASLSTMASGHGEGSRPGRLLLIARPSAQH
ncbi:hypothetical protein MesoLj113b_63590 [Mesorhizobium sp. 113-3-3]|nr:hypothetical protein MesoLj113b_63590 [Mesorhizobium sp. 113-3-3]BCG90693.1 hypothetical protein MesoLj113c_68030 [Mesorhizobium sp. 113-3-9]